ncbi:sugar O-acetyltransferase [Oscillatoria salina]|uniref:sugar O-acetyltransferase n=1 Tax=Oscillatoria salina TaxID=331517 RepID=UPI0013B61C67|nr:sugar O-acetyltransferase [Oscillatoria salina]MBZ8182298.1 sugar O-acetyltransferase [Oscillatoria salina IIICB1]NET89183.1 sugar O-acetyltransferase [Kamptonema sp. SIO1D9]
MEQPPQTEKEKMLAGELYLASDPELKQLRQQAAELTHCYHHTPPSENQQRLQILQQLFASLGANPEIVPPFHCDYGSNIYAGDNLYLNTGCVILDCNPVRLGDNVLCGPYVQIYAAYHPTVPEVRLTRRELAAPVTIGNNVWIGGGAIICPGVAIGDNTTIGAGSVVVESITANVIAAGNPCRTIRDA